MSRSLPPSLDNVATEVWRTGKPGRGRHDEPHGSSTKLPPAITERSTPMSADPSYEIRRTSPLALWRYSHEYVDVVQQLCGRVRVACAESQVPYHVAAQGIEFAFKSFLRARGATMSELNLEIGHSLQRALERCEAQGLPRMPEPWRAAIVAVAPFHQDSQFVYPPAPDTSYPDVEPLVAAGVWILDRIAPDIVDHYIVHQGNDATPPAAEYVRRLRAALSATSRTVHAATDENHHLGQTFDARGDAEVHPGSARAN
jgi:hypothetical protein